MFAGGFHASLKQPPVNVTPATIESTVALPCGPRRLRFAGARRVSAPSHPDSIERKRTRRRLLSSRLSSVHTRSRERKKQGRCEPGRRAVLEENKEPSDRTHCTLNEPFSQAGCGLNRVDITLCFSGLGLFIACGAYKSPWERYSRRSASVFTENSIKRAVGDSRSWEIADKLVYTKLP